MANCSDCGSCTACSDCAMGELILSSGEIAMLEKLGQIPFLPVARKMGSLEPVYLEDRELSQEEYSLILSCLEKRGLITLDFDKPLAGFDDAAYAAYPIRGSFALTNRGQKVLELLEIQGLDA